MQTKITEFEIRKNGRKGNEDIVEPFSHTHTHLHTLIPKKQTQICACVSEYV